MLIPWPRAPVSPDHQCVQDFTLRRKQRNLSVWERLARKTAETVVTGVREGHEAVVAALGTLNQPWFCV